MLIAVYHRDWSTRLCNGCYGRLLSLYEIKAGTAPDDERAGELAAALLSMVSLEDERQAERLFLELPKRKRNGSLHKRSDSSPRLSTWQDNFRQIPTSSGPRQ
jgi:hypothetical protein